MKTLASILALLFLVNCYSYKAVSDTTSTVPDVDKTYEITLKNYEKMRVTDLRKDGNQYTYTDKDGQTKAISADSVLLLREKKFSYGKTIGLVAGAVGVVVIIAAGMAVAEFGGAIQ